MEGLLYSVCVVDDHYWTATDLHFEKRVPYKYEYTYHNFIDNIKVDKCAFVNVIAAKGLQIWCSVVIVFCVNPRGKSNDVCKLVVIIINVLQYCPIVERSSYTCFLPALSYPLPVGTLQVLVWSVRVFVDYSVFL